MLLSALEVISVSGGGWVGGESGGWRGGGRELWREGGGWKGDGVTDVFLLNKRRSKIYAAMAKLSQCSFKQL